MKNVTIIIILTLFCSQLFGQTASVNLNDIKVPFRFEVTESADVQLGKNWDYSYVQMRTPILVSFTGEKLYMNYKAGSEFAERDISNYTVIEETKGLGKTKSFILESVRDGFTEYIVITFSENGFDLTYNVKYPYMLKGEVSSYTFYNGYRAIK